MAPLSKSRTKPAAKSDDSNRMILDRYAVAASAGEDRNHYSAISVNNSTTSGSLESSDSSTTSGTSYETDGSEALEQDDLDYDDGIEELEIMSIDTLPVMGGWVDSACGWLDRPMCFLNFGKETSLLRHSKGRTRATAFQQMRMSEALSTAANMKLSASERRILRLRRKGLTEQVEEENDGTTTKTGDGEVSVYDKQSVIDMKSQEVKLFSKKRIQPYNDRAEETTVLSQTSTVESTKRPISASADEDDERRLQGSGSIPSLGSILTSKSNHTEHDRVEESDEQEVFHQEDEPSQRKINPEVSVHSREGMKMKETVTMNASESVKVETDREVSVTLDKVLVESPKGTEHADTPKSLSMMDTSLKVPSLELPESESIKSTRKPEETKQAEKLKNPSMRSERSLLMKQRIMKVVKRSKSLQRKKEAEASDLTHMDDIPAVPSNDLPSLSVREKRHVIREEAKNELLKDIEIIDVLSLDDEDSWTPGNARDGLSRATMEKKNQHEGSLEKHQKKESKSRDPSPSLSRRATNAQGRDPSPLNNEQEEESYNYSSPKGNDVDAWVTSLWDEEAAKLNNESPVSPVNRSGLRNPSVAKAADDFWAQEEQKLQTDHFVDPKAREAFLGHRRGRLQAVGMESDHRSRSQSRQRHRSRSQSRQRRLAKALDGAEGVERADESNESRRRARSTRSAGTTNLDLRRPTTPENAVGPIGITRSVSREAPGISRVSSPRIAQRRQAQLASTTDYANRDDQMRVNPSIGSKNSKELVEIRGVGDAQTLRIARSAGRDKVKHGPDFDRHTSNKQPIDVHESDGLQSLRRKNGRSSQRSLERQDRSIKHRSKSRDIEIVDLADVEDVIDHRPALPGRDARDDRESKQGTHSLRRGSADSPPVEEWPDYETVISATRELRKLEKKIEKQLRQVKRETKSQEWDSQAVSSKEIRKLEKQLAQKLKRENENRGTKLKRIRRKVLKTPSTTTAGDEPAKPKGALATSSGSQRQLEPHDLEQEYQPEKQQPHPMPEDENEVSSLNKSFSQRVDDFREKSKFDLRSSSYLRASSPHGN